MNASMRAATDSPRVSFAEVAAACGYASSLETNDVGRISNWLNERPIDGARFARLLIRAGTPVDLPRPSVIPLEVKSRLMQHIGAPRGVY
jgi:phosphonopyruvate decarboxylase